MAGKQSGKQAGKIAGKRMSANAGSKGAGAKPKTGSRTKRGTQPRTKGKPKKPPAPGVAKRRSAALAKKSAAALAKSRSKGAKGKSAGSKAGGAKSQAASKPIAKPIPKPIPKPSAKPVATPTVQPGLPNGELKTILQTASFPADPSVVYDLIMDEKKHAAFTGAAARIGSKVGEAFSAYDGSCLGTHLELVKGTKIVQTWRESDWPEGHFSIATFLFAPGPGPESTTLTFIQTGVPAEAYDGIDSGWTDFYWRPMREMLEAE